MKITAANLIRWAGLSAMVAGIIFAAIQPIHPADVLSSVTTTAWAIITALKTAMCLLVLLGIAGLYARQVEKAGWLGLAGYLLFSLFWALTDGLYLRRSLYLAAVGDRGAEVCGGLPGDLHWARQRDEPRSPPSDLWAASRGRVYARRPAVWHRDVPRRHPAALGGRSACRRDRVDPRWLRCFRTSIQRASGGADGVSSGLAGLCALVGTARAQACGTRTWQGQAPSSAKPQPSKVAGNCMAWTSGHTAACLM